mgnify:CR=1 FL=1
MPRIRLRHPDVTAQLTGWVLVDDFGLPRYWATIWADVIKAGLKEQTRGGHLRGIEKLYQTVVIQTGKDTLDRLITDMDFDTLESVVGAFLTMLRNESAQSGVDREAAWSSALTFLDDVLSHLHPHAQQQSGELHARMHRLERLYGQITPSRPRVPAPIRALPAAVVEDLYRLFNPESPENPFRTPTVRWRNFTIFLMLLHLGLRRSEAANLPADAIKEDVDPSTGEIRLWVNVDEMDEDGDPRYEKPSLKTSHSRRQLPVSNEVVKVTDVLVGNYRRGMHHCFMFGSQQGKPLALRSFHRIFETVSQHLSPQSRKALKDRGKHSVSAHDLRHTCAVYRLSRYLASGDDMETAIDKLRVFFGWSRISQMPRHYARAYFETKLTEVWHDNYDTFVETLRSLEGVRA